MGGSGRMSDIVILQWGSFDENEKSQKTIGGLGGFFVAGMRWRDYLDTVTQEGQFYYETLRADIIQNGIRNDGNWHQEDKAGVPIFSDGTVGLFSCRAWGDILAAVWSEHENRDYSYIDFY